MIIVVLSRDPVRTEREFGRAARIGITNDGAAKMAAGIIRDGETLGTNAETVAAIGIDATFGTTKPPVRSRLQMNVFRTPNSPYRPKTRNCNPIAKATGQDAVRKISHVLIPEPSMEIGAPRRTGNATMPIRPTISGIPIVLLPGDI